MTPTHLLKQSTFFLLCLNSGVSFISSWMGYWLPVNLHTGCVKGCLEFDGGGSGLPSETLMKIMMAFNVFKGEIHSVHMNTMLWLQMSNKTFVLVPFLKPVIQLVTFMPYKIKILIKNVGDTPRVSFPSKGSPQISYEILWNEKWKQIFAKRYKVLELYHPSASAAPCV